MDKYSRGIELKKKRKKKRSCTEKEHIKLGNSQKFCSHCRPNLAKRLTYKNDVKTEIKHILNESQTE
jgi:hypothetical protein